MNIIVSDKRRNTMKKEAIHALIPIPRLLLTAALLDCAAGMQAKADGDSVPTNLVSVSTFPPMTSTNLLYLTNSFAWVGLGGVPDGYSVGNALYAAWCVEAYTSFAVEPYSARLYDSAGTNLAPHLRAEPWTQINYILNHRLGTVWDAQQAIWAVQDGTPWVDLDPGPVQDMVKAAQEHGPCFDPLTGQVRGVIVDTTAGVQRLIIAITNPPVTGTARLRLSLVRSNDTMSVSWPSPSPCWTLQENTNGVATANWSNVVSTPFDDGALKTVILNPSRGNRYYRLFKP